MEISYQSDPDSSGSARFTNRELSWLQFASRLLDLAYDEMLPTLERLKFLAIFYQGLDEFFQVRIAGLKDQLAAHHRLLSPDGRTPREQLQSVKVDLDKLFIRVHALWGELCGDLERAGIEIIGVRDTSREERAFLRRSFADEIYPILTPLAIDPSHPFPYISNLSLNLAVRIDNVVQIDSSDRSELKIARVKVPPIVNRFVELGTSGRFVPLEEIIADNVHMLFPNVEVVSTSYFRVTRNADIILEEGEADDLLELVATELRRRRFGRAVRLEVSTDTDADVAELLIRELDIHPDDVYRSAIPLGLDALWDLYRLDRPELKSPQPPTVPPVELVDQAGDTLDVFTILKDRDVLVHHPYESFSLSVESFIAQAARDPDVLAIKQTLYRTSGDSTIVNSLVEAAERGKQVAVLVEVKARFDELANITWAKTLEEAGVHVVYGLVGLKTHLKAILVVRKEGESLVRYCHLGTGNYNARTAKSYEDFGFLTSRQAFGEDLTEVFNMLTGFSDPERYQRLVLAPRFLRNYLSELIDAEGRKGEQGRIVIKVNGLVDPEMIDQLYRASQAGVEIDLIVRGICSLRPGIAGLSESIRVRSIVGSVLEHSRIYCFGGPDPLATKVFLSSADLMTRNLDRRVEVLFPLESNALRDRVLEFLDLELADDQRSWTLTAEHGWQRVVATKGVNAQELLGVAAFERSRARSDRRVL